MANASLAYEILLYLNSFYFGKIFHYLCHNVRACMCVFDIRFFACLEFVRAPSQFSHSISICLFIYFAYKQLEYCIKYLKVARNNFFYFSMLRWHCFAFTYVHIVGYLNSFDGTMSQLLCLSSISMVILLNVDLS